MKDQHSNSTSRISYGQSAEKKKQVYSSTSIVVDADRKKQRNPKQGSTSKVTLSNQNQTIKSSGCISRTSRQSSDKKFEQNQTTQGVLTIKKSNKPKIPKPQNNIPVKDLNQDKISNSWTKNNMNTNSIQKWIGNLQRRFYRFKCPIQQVLITFKNFYEEYLKLDIILQQNLKQQVIKQRSKQKFRDFFNELRIVDSAISYCYGNKRLEPVQILTIFMFLNCSTKNFFLQVFQQISNKSKIIACLAAILALRGFNVDIILSNESFAKNDNEKFSKFYQLMRLKSRYVKNKESLLKSSDNNQLTDILYGTFAQLKKINSQHFQNIQGPKNQRVSIVDDVDSMLQNEQSFKTEINRKTFISSDIISCLKIIWQIVLTYNVLVDVNGKIYFVKQGFEKGLIIQVEANKAIQLIIRRLKSYAFFNELMKDQNIQYMISCIKSLIQCAIKSAFSYRLQVDYEIKNQNIVAKNKSMIFWNQLNQPFGVKQFLQMKHGLDIQIQAINLNSIKIIAFLSKYQKIYGFVDIYRLQVERKFIQKNYKAEIFSFSIFDSHDWVANKGPTTLNNCSDWMATIQQICKYMIHQGRAVAIICQSVRHSKMLSQNIKIAELKHKLRLKIIKQENSVYQVDCSDLMILTADVGRAINFTQTQNLIKKSGLHIIISYMPANKRLLSIFRSKVINNKICDSSLVILDQFPKNVDRYYDWKQGHWISLQEVNNQENKRTILTELRNNYQLINQLCSVSNLISYNENILVKNGSLIRKCHSRQLRNQSKIYTIQQFQDKIFEDGGYFYKSNVDTLLNLNKKQSEKIKNYFIKAQNYDVGKFMKINQKICSYILPITTSQDIKLEAGNEKQRMLQVTKIIKEKRSFQRALRMINLSIDYGNIEYFLYHQKNNNKDFINKFFDGMDKTIDKFLSIKIEQKELCLSRKMMLNLLNFSQEIVYDILQKHIEQNLKFFYRSQERQQKHKSISNFQSLYSHASRGNKQLRSAIQYVASKIPYIPYQSSDKIKYAVMKRQQIFSLAIVQICFNALIALSAKILHLCNPLSIYQNVRKCIQKVLPQENQLSQFCKKYYDFNTIQTALSISNIGIQIFYKYALEKKIEPTKQVKTTLFYDDILKLQKQTAQRDNYKIYKGLDMSALYSRKFQNLNGSIGVFSCKGHLAQIFKERIQQYYRMCRNNQFVQNKTIDVSKIMDSCQLKSKVYQCIRRQKLNQKEEQKLSQEFVTQMSKKIDKIIDKSLKGYIPDQQNYQLNIKDLKYLIQKYFIPIQSQSIFTKNPKQSLQKCLIQTANTKNPSQNIIKYFKIETVISHQSRQQYHQIIITKQQNQPNKTRRNKKKVQKKSIVKHISQSKSKRPSIPYLQMLSMKRICSLLGGSIIGMLLDNWKKQIEQYFKRQLNCYELLRSSERE